MGRVSTLALRATCAALLLATMMASPLRAQDTIRPAPVKSVAARPATASQPAAADSTKPAVTSKSLPQRIFDTPWVLFPTRLTIVIVLLAVSALFLMSGCWGAVRFAHLLRHLEWKEPPRRLRRGELGAAGANVAFEFEERLNTKREEDEARDRQIAWLRTAVLRLSSEHNEVVAALELMDRRDINHHGTANDVA
jgi:hypothetical protein